jgi:hypothetical protein
MLHVQDMASRLRCSAQDSFAAAIGYQVSLSTDPLARHAAYNIATDMQSSFRARLKLNLHAMCHGPLHKPPHGLASSRATRPEILAPDAACTHRTEQLSANCMPLWQAKLFKGSCVTAQVYAQNRPVRIPVSAPNRTADVMFTTRGVDYFRSTCREVFSGFPAGWKHDFCVHFSAEVCASEAPLVTRFILEAGGPQPVPASLVLNGDVIALVENEPSVVATGNIAAWATTKSRDAIVVLRRGCHKLDVLFQDPSEGTKLSFGDEMLVCFSYRTVIRIS